MHSSEYKTTVVAGWCECSELGHGLALLGSGGKVRSAIMVQKKVFQIELRIYLTTFSHLPTIFGNRNVPCQTNHE
jgi:hypothetical protein